MIPEETGTMSMTRVTSSLGAHTIINVKVYFGTNDVQYKGILLHSNHYCDKDNGALVTNGWLRMVAKSLC